jgi:hypothetical protein
LTLPVIDARELDERLVQLDAFTIAWLSGADPIVQDQLHGGAGTLGRLMLARVIDQDAAHHLRGQREKVRAVLPGNPVLPHQPQVRLVDQRRGLEGVVRPLASQIRAGSSPQFTVDHRYQIVARLQVTTAPRTQQAADSASLTLRLVHEASAADALRPNREAV